MADPRSYRPGPYVPGAPPSGYPPHSNMGMMPGGAGQGSYGGPPPQHQQPPFGPSHYQQQPRPGFQGGMPMPHQPNFNNRPHQSLYPPVFNNNHASPGFNHVSPGPGPGPGHVPIYGGGGGPRPGFSPSQSYRPGTPPLQHAPSPMMMAQGPHPPRHQEWPIAGRPPVNAGGPGYPPSNPSLGYPPGGPVSQGPGSGLGHGHGQPTPFVPKPYAQPPMPPSTLPAFSNQPSYSGGLHTARPSYSPSLSAAAQSPTLVTAAPVTSTPKFPEAAPPAFPSVRPPSNPLVNPMAMPQPSAYKPKTSYQAAPAPSPKKDANRPLTAPSPTLSWQSTTPSIASASSQNGYQGSYHQRPPFHATESFDADDRPTELIPVDEEPIHIVPPSLPEPPTSSSSSKTSANTPSFVQSPPAPSPAPTSTAVSPSLSFTAVSYLPASPNFSDPDSRPTELPAHSPFTPAEPAKKPEITLLSQSLPKPPLAQLPTSSAKFPTASSFVPSTQYIPNKKDTPKVPTMHQHSMGGGYDPTVKVEVSDLKAGPFGAHIGDNGNTSIKVELSDKAPPIRQLSDSALDSPISLDGLLESIEAMAQPSSHQSPSSTQQSTSDYSKPLPVINESETEQKRYSLSDAPTSAGSSQSHNVQRLVPKRPSSSAYMPPPIASQQGESTGSVPSLPTTSSAFSLPAPPPQLPTSQPFVSQQQQASQAPQISFQQPHHQHNHSQNHNHSRIGGDAMLLFTQPEFVHNPITSMAAFADRPLQKAPSMARRAKTLRRAAGVTGANQQSPEQTVAPPLPPIKFTPDDLYPYLLRLVLLAQADEVAPPTPSLPATNKDTHKDLVKALRARVKDILSGKDHNPLYQDPVVKKALSNMEPKQFKASTNIEELMVGFSIEMSRIQQTMNIPTNNRDAQIAVMVSLMREAIQQDPFVGHEAILQRLDKTVKTTAVKPNNSAAQAEELTKVIKELFRMPESVRQQRMNDLRRNSTKQVAIEDLKKCASNLDLDSFPYPGIADYHHKEHHEEFKTRERSALNGFIRVLSAGHPALGSLDMPKRQFHPSEFTFIPENPKAYYHLLLEMCVDHALATRNESDPASSLLSTPTRALLIDCGVRWRLSSSWREIILMEVIKERYREGKVPVGFLLDFLHGKFYKDVDVHQWHISEVNMLGDVYGSLNHMIFDNINHDIKDLESVSADYFRPMLDILDRVHQQEVYQRLNIDLTPFFEDIRETVLLEAIRSYNAKDEEVQKERYENETVPLTKMALYIVSEHGIMKKRFPKPLFGTVDVAAIVVENNLRNYVPLMQNMANMDARKLPMADVFPLYQLCRELVSLFELYAPSSSAHFNISTWFRPYVLKYLETLDASITDWVTAAIKQDQFEEVSVGAGHSSSASDLFAFFYEPLTWVKGLNWPNDYQRATFISKLAKVFCKAVDLYAQYMETMFNGCMPSSVASVASMEVKTLSEQLASFAFRSESAEAKKAAQFVFTPKMCVLVNNIEAVRQRLDELYRNMDVDEVAQILRENDSELEMDPNTPHQFEIVFVSAERLLPMDSNEASDPFIVMTHDHKEVFRSKTISANINPRWNEVYEVNLTKEIVYLIRIFDADKVHKDRLCGWQHLHIDPQDYEDYMPHDVWLDLAQVGRLLLRITMKGEREDVQFFFGRTFRSLKRKEADLSGIIVDAMVPCIQSCLTAKVLFSNFRSKAMFPFFSSSVSSAKVTKVSDEDCDNALGPLLDYLEASLPILYDYLTTEGMTMVITKLWKEILIAIESLLVPPLSTALSDRTSLTEIEMHVVFKVVEFIKLYLNGGDAGDGFPLKVLETPKYRDLLTVRPIYDASTEDLVAEYNRALTVPGRGRLARNQSDYDRRSGGAGAVKRPGVDSMTPNPETVLRILRLRHEETVEPFLIQAIDTQSKAREARAQAKREQMAYQREIMRGQQLLN
ncbi:hypothetical protein BGX28_008487 [Mortierella sp. GBA30]|nr:hypothetical protein BGX28_008487 [Mortierella sp. GBA30]